MFNQVHGKFVYLSYYPVLSGVTMPASILSRDITSYRVDLMTFDPQILTLPIYDLNYQKTTSGDTANNAKINPLAFFSDIDGTIAIASDNTVANIASVDLFSIRVSYQVVFYHRL